MAGISEKSVSADTLLSIKRCAKTASRVLGIEPRQSTPSVIVSGIDEFVCQWQKGIRPAESVILPDDVPMILGSLWGEAIVSRFKWQWGIVIFPDQHQTMLPAVLAPDRSLAIFPLHFLTDCLNDPGIEPGIVRSYNLLKSGTIGKSVAGSYRNLMDEVKSLVSRG